MKKLGVAWIISVSAVGSLQKNAGRAMLCSLTSFLDRTKQSPAHTFFGRGIVAHIAFAHPICEELRQILLQTAKDCEAQVHDGGTYVCMEGPGVQHPRRIAHQPPGRLRCHRHDQPRRGKCAREAEIAYATLAMATDYDPGRKTSMSRWK